MNDVLYKVTTFWLGYACLRRRRANSVKWWTLRTHVSALKRGLWLILFLCIKITLYKYRPMCMCVCECVCVCVSVGILPDVRLLAFRNSRL